MLKQTSKILVLIIITFGLFACATQSKYIEQQKSWIGKSISQYIQTFGMPSNIIDVYDNPEIKTYVYVKTYVNPNGGDRGGQGGYNSLLFADSQPNFMALYALTCTTWVSIDKKTGIIKNITFRGSYCVSDKA